MIRRIDQVAKWRREKENKRSQEEESKWTREEKKRLIKKRTSNRKDTERSREKYKRAALLLTDFLDDLLTSTPNIL